MADGLNIKLYFIQAGMTDELQTLNRSIFGPFKAMSRRLFRERCTRDKPIKITKQEACADIIRAWDSVKIDSICNAWSIYNEEEWNGEQERKKLLNLKIRSTTKKSSNPKTLK